MGISGAEILLIMLVVLLLFGSEKMPGIARGMAKGYGEIKRASDDIKREILEGSSGIMEQVNEIKSDFNNQINSHTDQINKEIEGLNNTVKMGTTALVSDLNNTINRDIEQDTYQIPDVSKEIIEIREKLYVNEDVAEIRSILHGGGPGLQNLSEADDSYYKFYQNS
jgi:sec-independent protein translocase protein TatA